VALPSLTIRSELGPASFWVGAASESARNGLKLIKSRFLHIHMLGSVTSAPICSRPKSLCKHKMYERTCSIIRFAK
jgi:hypothetical protein